MMSITGSNLQTHAIVLHYVYPLVQLSTSSVYDLLEYCRYDLFNSPSVYLELMNN